MGGKKKQRSRQRKVEQKSKGVDSTKFMKRVENYRRTLSSATPASVCGALGDKEAVPSYAIFQLTTHVAAGGKDEATLTVLGKLIDGGIIQTLLSVLIDGCSTRLTTDEYPKLEVTFAEVWMRSLCDFLGVVCETVGRSDQKLEFACSVDPLLENLANEAGRTFFGTNADWHRCINPFVVALYNASRDEGALQILMSNELVLNFMVRAIFFGTRRELVDEARDAAGESGRDKVDERSLQMVKIALGFVNQALALYDSDARKLAEVGTIMVAVGGIDDHGAEAFVGRDEDDDVLSCPFLLGLIHFIKKCGGDVKMSDKDKTSLYIALLRLVKSKECVDERTVAVMIDLTAVASSTPVDAANNFVILQRMLPPEAEIKWAVAIDCGLLELMTRFLVEHSGRPDAKNELMDSIIKLIHNLETACGIVGEGGAELGEAIGLGASFPTSVGPALRALQARRDEIIAALEAAGPNIPRKQESELIFQCLCQMLADIDTDGAEEVEQAAPTTVEEAVVACSNCSVELEKGKRQRCNNCKTVYCSRDCQVQDWKNGHKKECKSIAEKKKAEESRANEAKKDVKAKKRDFLTRQLESSNDAQKDMDRRLEAGSHSFASNQIKFMMLAVAMGCDVRDCVCRIDVRGPEPVLDCLPLGEYHAYLHSKGITARDIQRQMEDAAGKIAIAFVLSDPREALGVDGRIQVAHQYAPYQKDAYDVMQKFKAAYPDDPALQVELMAKIQETDSTQQQMEIIDAVISGAIGGRR
mmetsp:Transcript_39305/g.94109  ORF Transcript_39305/g.94109 Transcript_39305/m.94109 type:complete len:756 (-) Transcript_39305:29-2296(-)